MWGLGRSHNEGHASAPVPAAESFRDVGGEPSVREHLAEPSQLPGLHHSSPQTRARFSKMASRMSSRATLGDRKSVPMPAANDRRSFVGNAMANGSSRNSRAPREPRQSQGPAGNAAAAAPAPAAAGDRVPSRRPPPTRRRSLTQADRVTEAEGDALCVLAKAHGSVHSIHPSPSTPPDDVRR